MTNQTDKPALPAFALDYEDGIMTNTLTGEFGQSIEGVVLAYREDRTLYPTIGELPRLPLCVNGSQYGPCACPFADFGPNGEAPECAEELTLLIWSDEGAQVATLTARRTQARLVNQYLNMKSAISGVLHDQRVTIRMTPGDGLHHLTVVPGDPLDRDTTARMAAIAERVRSQGLFEVL